MMMLQNETLLRIFSVVYWSDQWKEMRENTVAPREICPVFKNRNKVNQKIE